MQLPGGAAAVDGTQGHVLLVLGHGLQGAFDAGDHRFRSALLMLPVRSATRARSIGLGDWAPHEPRQASEAREPVFPVLIPMAGAKAKGTFLSSATVIVLQVWPYPGMHGIAQICSLHLAPATVPGLQTLGI